MQKPLHALVLSRNIVDENALYDDAQQIGSRRQDLQFWNLRDPICRIEIRFRRQRKELRTGSFDAGAKSRSRIDGDLMTVGHQNPSDREHWVHVAGRWRRSDKNFHVIFSL